MWMRVLSAVALYAAATASVQAADTASAESFLRQLYAGYAVESGPKAPQPLGPQAGGIFDKDLLGLIRRDQSTTPEGEGGLLRADPICDCQDWEKLRVQKVTVQPKGVNQADATVSFVNGGENHTLSYQLVNENGQWRIHDVQSGNQPGLRQYLTAGLAQRAAEAKAAPLSAAQTSQTQASNNAGSEASTNSPPPPSPQDTTYLYAVTVHDDGSVSLKQAETFSTQLVSRARCSQIGMRQQPNARPEWHLQQMGGWFNGACQMLGTAEFETLDALRAYLKMTGVGTAMDEGCGLTLNITLPFQPPNPTTYATVRLKLPGAEPITKGAQRGTSDKDELTWTFTRRAQQSLALEVAATSAFSDSKSASTPTPSFAFTKATTQDAQSVSVSYRIGKNLPAAPVVLDVYRSSESHVNDTSDFLGEAELAEADLQSGEHNDVKLKPTFDLLPNTAKPFVVVQRKGDGPKCSSYFRKYLLGVISHGFSRWNAEIPVPVAPYFNLGPGWAGFPEWEAEMASDLKTFDHYDGVIQFDWSKTCALAEPNLTVDAGSRLASQVLQWLKVKQDHPGDVVDFHFIGHSRGTVVITQAIKYLSNIDENFGGGYAEVTLLDPHPANNDFEQWASFQTNDRGEETSTARAFELGVEAFQRDAHDPPVYISKGVKSIDVWYQHTLANRIPFNLDFSNVMNLWGMPNRFGKNASIINDSTANISEVPLSQGGAIVTHNDVPEIYDTRAVRSGTLNRQP